MNDQAIDAAITKAQKSRSPVAELERLRDRVRAENGPTAPELARVWDALVRAARSSGDVPKHLAHLRGRAEWATGVHGPAHADAIRAWAQLGGVAEHEMEWAEAARAWEAIAHAKVAADAPDAVLIDVGSALRGLGAIRLKQGRLEDARALAERDLAIRERLPANPPSLALSLDNLAGALEQAGEGEKAVPYRERQVAVLEAAFGPDDVRTRTARAKLTALQA